MPHKDKDVRRQYMREYKARNRDKLLELRRQLYLSTTERPDFWSAGHSDGRVCLNCGGLADMKPLEHCSEDRHEKDHRARQDRNNEYRRRKRQEAKDAGTVYRKGRGDIQNKSEYQKKVNRDLREQLMVRLGQTSCVRCGYNDARALQFDHKLGGGSKHRREIGNGIRYLRHLMSLADEILSSQFQVLCANCNQIKREENGENYAKEDSKEEDEGLETL